MGIRETVSLVKELRGMADASMFATQADALRLAAYKLEGMETARLMAAGLINDAGLNDVPAAVRLLELLEQR